MPLSCDGNTKNTREWIHMQNGNICLTRQTTHSEHFPVVASHFIIHIPYILVLVHIYYITIHQWLLVTYKKNQPQTTSTTEKTWQAMKKEHSLTFIFSSSCFFFDNLLSHITFSCVPHLFSMLDLTIFIFIFLSCLCLFMCFISILVCTRFSFH